MAIGTALAVVGTAANLFGAASAASGAREAQRLAEEGGQMSQAASYANAADVESLGALNAGAITGAAKNNASMYREIGYANAQAIVDATMHNLRMATIENDEQQRLHIRDERWHAGNIRAMASSSGVMVNSGSPLAFLNSEISKGIQERDFLNKRALYAMVGMAEDGLRQSLLTVKSANLNAKVTEQNAALQANVAMSEAIARAAAMRRQGDINAQVGVANGQAAYYGGMSAALGGLSNAASSASTAYTSWRNNSVGPTLPSPYGSFNSWMTNYAGP